MDALTELAAAVKRLQDEQDALVEACTDPEATDMAQMLYEVQAARIALQAVERDLEAATAKAMLGDYAETPTLRVERYRSKDRKSWDHEAWQREVRAKVIRKAGLAGAQGIVNAEGEVLEAGVLHTLLAEVQNVHGAGAPKITGLRGLGIDAQDYCETSPGVWHVKVQRLADESQPAEDEGGQTDAA